MHSRQVTRAMERTAKKADKRQQRMLSRRSRILALRKKQAEAPSAPSFLSAYTGSRSTPIDQRKIRKGKPFGRTLYSQVIDGVEISYHATKGWRRHAA